MERWFVHHARQVHLPLQWVLVCALLAVPVQHHQRLVKQFVLHVQLATTSPLQEQLVVYHAEPVNITMNKSKFNVDHVQLVDSAPVTWVVQRNVICVPTSKSLL